MYVQSVVCYSMTQCFLTRHTFKGVSIEYFKYLLHGGNTHDKPLK